MRWSYLTSGMNMRGVDTTRKPWKTKKEPPKNNFWRELYDYMTICSNRMESDFSFSYIAASEGDFCYHASFCLAWRTWPEIFHRNHWVQPTGNKPAVKLKSQLVNPFLLHTRTWKCSSSYKEVLSQLIGVYAPRICRMVPPVISWFINPIDYSYIYHK